MPLESKYKLAYHIRKSHRIFIDSQSNVPEKDIPFEIDAGLLTVTDPNPIDVEAYE
jgi:hypothetical protein